MRRKIHNTVASSQYCDIFIALQLFILIDHILYAYVYAQFWNVIEYIKRILSASIYISARYVTWTRPIQ